MIRKLLVLFFCLLPIALSAQNIYKSIDTAYYSNDTVHQRDLIDIFRSIYKVKPRPDTDQKKGKIYFSFLPVATGVQGPGRALITSTTAGFYLGEKATTSISSISFTPYFNLKGRYGIPIRSNIWLNNDTWNIQGDTRFLVYPTYTWGLIGNQPESNSFLLNYKYVRFYQAL